MTTRLTQAMIDSIKESQKTMSEDTECLICGFKNQHSSNCPWKDYEERIAGIISKEVPTTLTEDLKQAFFSQKMAEKSNKITTRKKRGSILIDAHKIINGERQDQYGNPEDSFQMIADLWNVYLANKYIVRLDKKDVAMMMALLKIARESNQHKSDNLIDACGYLALKADME